MPTRDELQNRRRRVLEAVQSCPGASGNRYARSLNLQPMQVRNDLHVLAQGGQVRSEGLTRGTKWYPTPKQGGTVAIDLKSPEFKGRIAQADEAAVERKLDKWGTRIVWVCLTMGPRMAKRYASKNNKASMAWHRYHRLLDLGLLSEDPVGIAYVEGIEPWESDSMLWFDTLVQLSVEGEPPPDLPRFTDEE